LIYASTPFRGLDILLEVFPTIKKFVPDAELHVFSSMKVYGENEAESPEFEALYKKAHEMEGVINHGTVRRDELARHFKESAVLAYPNTFVETMCITAAQAVVTGTPIVTSHKGALPEVIPKGCGILLEGDPKSKEYQDKFVNDVVGILQNPEIGETMRECGKKAMEEDDFSWESIVDEWVIEFFVEESERELVRSKPTEAQEQPKNINTPEYWDKVYQHEYENKADGHRLDTERFDSILEEVEDGKTILDYGCGLGIFLQYAKFKKPNLNVYGMDFSPYALSVTKKRVPDARLVLDFKNLPHDLGQGDYFDYIVCQHVLEHVDDDMALIKKFQKYLTKDGTLILVLPINDDPWHEHIRIYKQEDVEAMMDELGVFYKIEHRVIANKIKKISGKPMEEAIIYIKFK
jgi:2-polyprenyl-3-methyl-5-hydroxy-6-metoxy-1,4-benzoquinol methylase